MAHLAARGIVQIVAEVDVAADAVSGKRDIAFKRSVLQSAIAVYDRVNYVKVTPDSALAHLGSEKHPKGTSSSRLSRISVAPTASLTTKSRFRQSGGDGSDLTSGGSA